jgi:hypothetical protein
MDVRLRLPDDPDGSELKQLYDWLIRDRELHLEADISLRADAEDADIEAADTEAEDAKAEEPGTRMGLAFDMVQLIVDSGFQLASLGIAIIAWRRAQRPRSSVVVERNGFRVSLPPGAADDDVEAIVRALENTGDAAAQQDPEDSPRDPEDRRPPEGDNQ